MHFAKLTERELDKRIADKLMPAGCDQQGRHAVRDWPDTMPVAPYGQPAEACTEVGAEPTGQHRTSALIRAYLAARRWLF